MADNSFEHTADAEPIGDEELDFLRLAEANLRPAPWVVWDDGDIGTGYSVQGTRYNRKTREREPVEVESAWIFNGDEADSAAVVALRNGLPGLLARLGAVENRVRELEEELKTAGTPF